MKRLLLLLALVSLGRQNLPAQPPRHVTLLHIADTHAQLETHPEYIPGEKPELQQMGGYAGLKTAIERERARAQGAVFLADGGDTFQGSGPAAWSKGEVAVATDLPRTVFSRDGVLSHTATDQPRSE